MARSQHQPGLPEERAELRLYREDVVNLDFHAIPHYGEESVLETHWAGAKNKRIKSALTLFAQDSRSRLVLYTDADIQRSEAADGVLDFVDFWKRVEKGVVPKLVFDSQFTTYPKLAALNPQGVKFLTLRRRGRALLKKTAALTDGWQRIHVPHAKRKFPTPQVLESRVRLRGYPGELRQLIMRGNGHEKPTFLITNDFDPALLVGTYAERWHVENGIAEAVKFFHINALSSPILVKVHMDVFLTVLADTLYYLLAQRLRGFEDCNAPRIYRHFVEGQGEVHCDGRDIRVTFPRRAHNPVLRAVRWDDLPDKISWLDNASLRLALIPPSALISILAVEAPRKSVLTEKPTCALPPPGGREGGNGTTGLGLGPEGNPSNQPGESTACGLTPSAHESRAAVSPRRPFQTMDDLGPGTVGKQTEGAQAAQPRRDPATERVHLRGRATPFEGPDGRVGRRLDPEAGHDADHERAIRVLHHDGGPWSEGRVRLREVADGSERVVKRRLRVHHGWPS